MKTKQEVDLEFLFELFLVPPRSLKSSLDATPLGRSSLFLAGKLYIRPCWEVEFLDVSRFLYYGG